MRVHLLLPALLPFFSACSTTPSSEIEGDGDGQAGSLILRVPFDEDQLEMPDPGDFVTGIQLHASTVAGDFDQELSGVDSIEVDQVTFAGPGTVNIDIKHAFIGLGVFGEQRGDDFGYSGAIGLGNSILDLEADGLGTSDDLDTNEVGFFLDGTIDYSVAGPATLFYTMHVFHGFGSESPEIFQVRIGAEWQFSPHFRASAGLQNWEYIAERSGTSDLRLELEGVFLQLQLTL